MDKEQMQARLEICEREQAQMKAVNAYYRKHGTVIGCPALSEEQANTLDEDVRCRYPMHNQPYMPYVLKNNASEIRRLKAQLDGRSPKNNNERGR